MATHYIQAILQNSMAHIFPDTDPDGTPPTHLSCLANEPLSFSVAYKLVSDRALNEGVYLEIESELPISLYAVGYLPVLQTRDPDNDDCYRAGLFGDILFPKKVNPPIKELAYPWATLYTLSNRKTTITIVGYNKCVSRHRLGVSYITIFKAIPFRFVSTNCPIETWIKASAGSAFSFEQVVKPR